MLQEPTDDSRVRTSQRVLFTNTHGLTEGVRDFRPVLIGEVDGQDYEKAAPRSQSPELLAGVDGLLYAIPT